MKHYTRITDMSETHNGLLKTRAELFNEAEQITERLAHIKNNVAALDRTLRTVGYKGELDMIMPKYQRGFRFDQGDLAKAAEPPRVCRRLLMYSNRSHYEQFEEQIFT